MVDARDQVHVLLTSESRASSSRYEIVIGSTQNSVTKLRRIKSNASTDVITANLTSSVKENQMRSFWIEVEKERVLFGSGEKVMKSHDPKLHKLKYCQLKFTPLPWCQSTQPVWFSKVSSGMCNSKTKSIPAVYLCVVWSSRTDSDHHPDSPYNITT